MISSYREQKNQEQRVYRDNVMSLDRDETSRGKKKKSTADCTHVTRLDVEEVNV